MSKVLIVDDEETIRKLLTAYVQRKGHEVIAVEDGFRAVDVYPNFLPDVIVSDIKMPKMDGFQMWEALKGKHSNLPPIVYITGHGEKTAAIESLRRGAFDYLEKPFDMDDFGHRLEAAVKHQAMQGENRKLAGELSVANEKLKERLEARTELVHRIQCDDDKTVYSLDLLGNSPAVQPIKETIAKLSKSALGSEVGVLITGPSGSGKEVAARLVHETSMRAKGPWVPVNCGALPDNLIESELFGHEKGAFTGANFKKMGVFELADGGTLFLDEIGELPMAMQTKLLRAIQEKSFRRVGGSAEIKVDVRVVAATNKDLRRAIDQKTFREDLYYRLNTVQVQLPTLKDRTSDLPFYAKNILSQITKHVSKAPREILSDCFPVLESYDWPGNLRELKSVLQRAALLSSGPVLTKDAVVAALNNGGGASRRPAGGLSLASSNGESVDPVAVAATPVATASAATAGGVPYHVWKKNFMKTMEKEYLQQQLVYFHGNVSAMSRFMKVSRPNLCRLLKKHGLHAGEFRDGDETAAAAPLAA